MGISRSRDGGLVEEWRLPAGGAFIITDEQGNELFRVTASGDAVKINGIALDPATLDEVATLGGLTATAAEINTLAGVTAGAASASKAVVLSSTLTLTGKREPVVIQASTPVALAAADSGKTYVATVADCVFTLPATVAGLRYRFIAGALSVVTGLSVSPNAADKIMGSVLAVVFTAADNKDAINTGATDAIGDFIELVGDGVDGWYIIDGAGVWAREG